MVLTDFHQLQLGEGVVGLKELNFYSLQFEGGMVLK